MHIELLVEDSSGKRFLEVILPRILGPWSEPHTWRVIGYKGVGRLPGNLEKQPDPAKRALLNQLPKLIRGYGRTPGIDAVAIIVDADKRDCREFLREINAAIGACTPRPAKTLVRIAIEELEAWYFGDLSALASAYPKYKKNVVNTYVQDSACDTWELLADAIFPGGRAAIKKQGWPAPGDLKHQWAKRITAHMDVENNQSLSFCKLRD